MLHAVALGPAYNGHARTGLLGAGGDVDTGAFELMDGSVLTFGGSGDTVALSGLMGALAFLPFDECFVVGREAVYPVERAAEYHIVLQVVEHIEPLRVCCWFRSLQRVQREGDADFF